LIIHCFDFAKKWVVIKTMTLNIPKHYCEKFWLNKTINPLTNKEFPTEKLKQNFEDSCKKHEVKESVVTPTIEVKPEPKVDVTGDKITITLQPEKEIVVKDKPTWLGGPFIAEYLTIGDKKIYLFGEQHVKDIKCQSNDYIKFTDYLEQNLTSTEKNIDVFLESDYTKKERKAHTNYKTFTEIGQQFKECFEQDKNLCKYKHTRFHNIDIRALIDDIKLTVDSTLADKILYLHKYIYLIQAISDMIRVEDNLYDVYDKEIKTRNEIKKLSEKVNKTSEEVDLLDKKKAGYTKYLNNLNEKIFKSFKKRLDILITKYNVLSIDSYVKSISKRDINHLKSFDKDDVVINILDKLKISKQLEGIKDVDITNKIYDNITNQLDKDLSIVADLLRYLSELNEGVVMNVEDFLTIRSLSIDIGTFYGSLVDFYTISRMFRSYEKERQNIYSNDAKNIIFYAGELHRRNIHDFLIKLGAKSHIYEENKDQNCVNISKFDYPLF